MNAHRLSEDTANKEKDIDAVWTLKINEYIIDLYRVLSHLLVCLAGWHYFRSLASFRRISRIYYQCVLQMFTVLML